jgi:pimeloyl-ACP methyl ester carboxylesterase
MDGVVPSRDGVPVTYEVHGSGTPALVFGHGWSCDRSYWRGQVGAFAARHRVVAVDLAGHGRSGTGRSAWTMPAFGEDVAAVVAELELGDLVLVGHSMGGDVIVETALDLPGQVVGLVWVDTYDTLEDPEPREAIEASMARSGRTSLALPEASSGGCPGRTRIPPWSNGWPPTWRPPRPRSRSTPWSAPSATTSGSGPSWSG